MDTISVYTDGSCSFKDKTGGWAFIALMGERHILGYGHMQGTTVSVMELTAIVKALERIRFSGHALRIFSDSQYVVNTVNQWSARWELNGWRTLEGEEIANVQLVQQLRDLVNRHKKIRPVTVSWVKGHAKNVFNERADFLAGRARVEKVTSDMKVKDNGVDAYVFHKDESEVILNVDRVSGEILAASRPSILSKVGKQLQHFSPISKQRIPGKWTLMDIYPLKP
ncbi:MAG: ribonuclease H [Chitinophagaceae bacterium]